MKGYVVLVCLVGIVMTEGAPSAMADQPNINCNDVPPRPESEEDWAVLVPNPDDCKSYYVCDGTSPVWMPCPDGLHFNPELAVCDWPSAANCTDRKYDSI